MPDEKLIAVSIHQDRRKEVNEVLAGLKKREMGKSATICRLLVEFKKRGYRFEEVK
jgi:hypothetical protein